MYITSRKKKNITWPPATVSVLLFYDELTDDAHILSPNVYSLPACGTPVFRFFVASLAPLVESVALIIQPILRKSTFELSCLQGCIAT